MDIETHYNDQKTLFLPYDHVSLKTFRSPKICQVCLLRDGEESMFTKVIDSLSISDIIYIYLSIQVNCENDETKYVCQSCVIEGVTTHEFLSRARHSYSLLQRLGQVKNENSDDDVECLDDLEVEQNYVKLNSSESPDEVVFEGPPFNCRSCSATFDAYELLAKHEKATHNESTVTCAVCSKTFARKSKLRLHMRVHTKEKPYACAVCQQRFSLPGNLKRHTRIHTGEKPYVCDLCGKGFNQSNTLHLHKKTHLKSDILINNVNQNYVCSYCGRAFSRISRYKTHVSNHLQPEHVSQSPNSKKNDLPRFRCELCDKTYKTKALLNVHKIVHSGRRFLCSQCGKDFTTRASLLSHVKVHSGERPHCCTVCSKTFAHIASFNAHVLIHTGERPHRCDVCSRSFIQTSHLKSHMRTHSGEKPYVCSYCDKRFAMKTNLTVHVRIHTGETPYICQVCGKGFYDSSSMRKHQKSHDERQFEESVQKSCAFETSKTETNDILDEELAIEEDPDMF